MSRTTLLAVLVAALGGLVAVAKASGAATWVLVLLAAGIFAAAIAIGFSLQKEGRL